MKKVLYLFCFLFCHSAYSQSTVSGIIKDASENPLPGVAILIKGTSSGDVSDLNGAFSLSAPDDAILVFSYLGYATQEIPLNGQSIVDVILSEDAANLSEIVIVGSRSQGRTKILTPAPVDIINITKQSVNMPQLGLSQMLAASAPSFSAFSSQGGDLSSHVVPPTLRGLAPNQTLVLINGKRRHTSALLAGTQTGSSANSVDLSFIAPASIERVEILRDGAAAQYGSDAIAGVMNIITKKGTGKFTGDLTVGFFPNMAPTIDDPTISANQTALIQDTEPDGETAQFTGNYGVEFENGGFFNIGGLYRRQSRSIRANIQSDGTSIYGSSYLNNLRTDTEGNPIITNPELLTALASGNESLATELRTDDGLLAARGLTRKDVSTFAGQPRSSLSTINFSLEVPVAESAQFYTFGDFGYKYLEGFSCFYRRAAQVDRANFDLYPNGFRPQMTSDQTNLGLTAGIKGEANDYKYDFSTTLGSNGMVFNAFNSFNGSLQGASPTEMNLGTHSFTQSTTNFDISRFFPDVLNGLNIAAGVEARVENYKIIAGQEESYTYYDAGVYVASVDNEALIGPDGMPLEGANSAPLVDEKGCPIILPNAGFSEATVKLLAGNNQCFRGFAPENESNETRFVTGAYLDIELDVTDRFLVTGAVRSESYSDFGSVVTGKLASRFSITDDWAIRGSYSSGFRAPSLQELNYSHTFTFFVGLEPFDGTLYQNNSEAARAIGITQLQEETSKNLSLGIAGRLFDKLNVTIDAYKIDISDRLFTTDNFSASDSRALGTVIGQGLASFRVNGGDISTKGIEIVLNYGTKLGPGLLNLMYSSSFRENTFEGVNVPVLNTSLSDAELASRYVDQGDINQYEQGVPTSTIIMSGTYTVNKFSGMLRMQNYGSMSDFYRDGTGFAAQEFSAQTVFDVGLTYQIDSSIGVTIGGNNIFNAYPDFLNENNRGFYLYSNYQQGSNGSYYFGRLTFNF